MYNLLFVNLYRYCSYILPVIFGGSRGKMRQKFSLICWCKLRCIQETSSVFIFFLPMWWVFDCNVMHFSCHDCLSLSRMPKYPNIVSFTVVYPWGILLYDTVVSFTMTSSSSYCSVVHDVSCKRLYCNHCRRRDVFYSVVVLILPLSSYYTASRIL